MLHFSCYSTSHPINPCRNRFLAKQQLWTPTIDDGYDGYNIPDNDYTPTLVPVFDPTFISVAAVNHAVIPFNAPPPDVAIDMAQQSTLTTPLTTHDNMAPHKHFTFSPVLLPETGKHGEFLDFVD